MYIHTENSVEIASKDEYVNAHIKIVEDINTRSGETFEREVTIKGRGNSTWLLPKKPYALKFNKKTSLLGEPKDKSWVLLANYADKTNLRNETSFLLGRMSNLAWAPRTHFVELFMNEVYCGTYQLCEKIKIAESRVNVTDDGYLMEIDQPDRIDPEDASFKTSIINVCIKDPTFVALVKERFAYFKSKKNDIMIDINENANYLKYSVVENNAKWNTLYQYTWPNYAIWGSYDNEVQYLKLWLNQRFEWLDKAFAEL